MNVAKAEGPGMEYCRGIVAGTMMQACLMLTLMLAHLL